MEIIMKVDCFYIVNHGISYRFDSYDEVKRIIARYKVNYYRTLIEANKKGE